MRPIDTFCVMELSKTRVSELLQTLKKGRTYPLKINEIFLKLWYDYFVLAIRENVKMVSTRAGIFHASRCWSIMIA